MHALASDDAHARDRHFAQLAEGIADAVVLLDAEFRETLYANAAYETIWGRSRESFYAQPQSFLNSVVPEDQLPLLENIARARQGDDPGPIDFRIVVPDGSIRWLQAHGMPIRDEQGDVYRLCAVIRDITAQTRRRLALEEREARLRALTDASFDAVAITQDGIIRDINRGFLTTFGCASDEDAIGHKVVEFCADESRETIAGRIATGIVGTYDVAGRRKDGTTILLEVTARTHMVDGRPGRVSACRDVTAQRWLEAQVHDAVKVEAIGRLAGGVAHEFNNLLTIIRGHAEIMADTMEPGSAHQHHLDEISNAAAKATAFTRQLVAFSQQRPDTSELVTLERVIADAEPTLRRLLGEQIELTVRLSETAAAIRIDPAQLDQILFDLARHAHVAMSGHGTVTIETGAVEVGEAFANANWPAFAGRFARLSVTDSAPPLDSRVRSRIFEPFSTRKSAAGLHLATVHAIIKRNGGFICAESGARAGTRFDVYLPLERRGGDGLNAEQMTHALPRGTETVLVVQDSRPVRTTVCLALERLGYDVIEAASVTDAMAAAADPRSRIDLLLTDIVMPEMTGRDLVQRFESIGVGAKVIFLSSHAGDDTLRRELPLGAVLMQQPFTAESLAPALRRALDN